MYTLRFPFRLPPDREIAVTETTNDLDGLTISLEKKDMFYVFTIKGFPTEETAKHYINNVWAGLMWVLLNLGLSPEAIIEPRDVVYTDDRYQAAKNLRSRDPVDGLIDGGSPAVYLTEKQLETATGGQVSVLVTTHAYDVLRLFCQAQIEMSSSSQSRNVRFYVSAAAACVSRVGSSRLRHG